MRQVYVLGVGMCPFAKPGVSRSYPEMVTGATKAALEDSGITYSQVQQAYVGYVYGDSTSGQRALYPVGMSGIPIINVNNNCATGSTALFLAKQAVENGSAECVIAVGFEQMPAGALRSNFTDRPDPLGQFVLEMEALQGSSPAPFAAQLFGGAGREYMDKWGSRPETFGKIAVKARRHAANNPYAVFRDPVDIDQVMNSPVIFDPLTRLQCCPPTCGAAVAILCTKEFAKKNSISLKAAILAQTLITDEPDTFNSKSKCNIVGAEMTRRAARQVYEIAGIGPDEIDVVELHDCFTANELITYEGLGLAGEGQAEKFIEDGDNTYGGKVVVNPSGGLLSKGHPLGATGLAQCAELVWQLQGKAEKRQVEDARLALQHNLGLGGACVVTIYGKV